MRTTWRAVCWLLALALVIGAAPVHNHGAVQVAVAIQAATAAAEAPARTPCAACRLMHIPALVPAAEAAMHALPMPEAAIWPLSRQPESAGPLSPAAPRGPPVLI